MPYEFFYNRFPEIAEQETRTITINDGLKFGLPIGEYAFLEMFCNESGCDCRRVFFYVVYSNRIQAEAVIAYGWENTDYYAKWMGDNDPDSMRELNSKGLF